MTTETVHHMPQGSAHARKQRSCLPQLRRHTAKQTERAPAKYASTTAPHKQPPFLRNFRQFLMALQANLTILIGHLRVLPCLTLTFFSGSTSLLSYTGCFSLTKLKIPFQGPSSNADFVAAWIPLWPLKILTIFNPEPNSVSFVRGLSTSFQAEALSGHASLPSSDFFLSPSASQSSLSPSLRLYHHHKISQRDDSASQPALDEILSPSVLTS